MLSDAFQASTSGRPGATYVGLPSNVLLQRLALQGPTSLDQILGVHLPLTAGEARIVTTLGAHNFIPICFLDIVCQCSVDMNSLETSVETRCSFHHL